MVDLVLRGLTVEDLRISIWGGKASRVASVLPFTTRVVNLGCSNMTDSSCSELCM